MCNIALKIQIFSDKDGLQEFSRRVNEIVQHVTNQERSDTAYVHCNSEQIELGKYHFTSFILFQNENIYMYV